MDLRKTYVFILPYGPKLGGVEGWTYSMVRQIRSIGGKAYILSLRNSEETTSDLLYPSDILSSVHEVIFSNSGLLLTSGFLNQCVDRILSFVDGDIVLIPNYGSFAYTIAAGVKAAHSPKETFILCYLHADDRHYYDVARFFSPYVDRFVCVSKKVEMVLGEKIPWRKDSFEYRPCGIEMPKEEEKDILLEKPFSEALKIAYVGRLSNYQKRILDLPLLVEHLRGKKGRYELHIVGDGEDRKELEQTLNKINIGRTNIDIHLHGKLGSAAVYSILRESSVFFSCSAFEGASIALLESLALGCIPVVTDVSGVRDLIQHKKNGFIFEVGNIAEAAKHLEHIFHMDRAAMGGICAKNKEIGYSHTMSQYLQWFDQLVERLSQNGNRLSLADLQRNWDYTWNPAIFQNSAAHPFFIIYDRVKARWYGRYVIKIAKQILKLLRVR